MLDRLLGLYVGYKYTNAVTGYDATMAITCRRFEGKSLPTITVLFPPWRGGELLYDFLTRHLLKSGSAVLRYNFNHQILEPNHERVLKSFQFIQHKVSEDVNELVKKHGFRNVDLVASSLGNTSLALVAKKLDNFNSATLVVAGSNLAKSTWEGARTQSLRKSFEHQGLNEAFLDKQWASIAPKSAAMSFKDKPVRLITSSTDTIIPYKYQLEMIKSLQSAGAKTHVATYKTGHIATIFRACISGSTIARESIPTGGQL